jgi:uncharacterized protein
MLMRSTPFYLVLIGLMLLLDFYVFQAIKTVSQGAGARARSIIYIVYWSVSVLGLLLFILLPYLNLENHSKGLRTTIFAIVAGLFFAKFMAAIFFLIDDLRRLIQWVAGKTFFSAPDGENLQEGERISRSLFLSWIGLAAGGGIFGTLVNGFSNKYNYEVKKVKLSFPNLPAAFKGLKVVQLSDIHSGSLNNKSAVQKGILKVLSLKPDLIVFTGDLVNNKATELEPFMDVFNQLQAPMGVYSILGNHDYGDYVEWPTAQAKRDNLEIMKQSHAALGWKLLMNENAIFEKDGEKIALLGIENWSAKARFPKYGKLEKAYAGTEAIPFKLLLSHDPSHWDAEVRTKYPDIDLMLSGHTHGMQFGVELPWFKWSPVQYVYQQWAGLYRQAAQHLYVNRGFGFIGYPGRVGIMPEITLLELV